MKKVLPKYREGLFRALLYPHQQNKDKDNKCRGKVY